MSEPAFNPHDPIFDIYKGSKTSSKQEPNDVFSDFSDSNLDVDSNNKRERITLDKLPIDKHTAIAANIYTRKLEQIAKIYTKMAQNVKEKNYFPKTKEEQDELILAAEAWIKLMEPLNNDKYTLDWKELYEPIVKQLNYDNHWTEDSHWIREIRYKIQENGQVINQYPHTKNHILGGSIINRINSIIMISDCIPFLGKIFENNRKTRYPQQAKRDVEKYRR